MKRIFTILSVLVALIGVVSCSSSSLSSPTDVVEEYIKSLKNDDYGSAIDLFYFSAVDSKTIEENKEKMVAIFDRFVKPEFDKNGGIDSYEIKEETIDEDGLTATVAFDYVYGNGEVEPVTSKLKKIDGKWYLDSGK